MAPGSAGLLFLLGLLALDEEALNRGVLVRLLVGVLLALHGDAGPVPDTASRCTSSVSGSELIARSAFSAAARSKRSPGSLTLTPPPVGVPSTGPLRCCMTCVSSCASVVLPAVEWGS